MNQPIIAPPATFSPDYKSAPTAPRVPSAEAPSKAAGPVGSLAVTNCSLPVSSAEALASAWEKRAAKPGRTHESALWLRFCAEELRREIFWAKRGPGENSPAQTRAEDGR